MFGTGTAAVISPVGHLRYGDNVVKVQDGGIGPVSQKLYDNIRNYAKKDSLYVFSDKIRNAIQEKKVGKYQQDDFDLYNVEYPKPKSLELRGEKTLLSSPSREDSKKSEIKF